MRIGKILEKRCTEKCIPFSVIFELTYRCNLSCSHCYVVKDQGGELTFQEIAAILDQLVELGTFYLTFTGGEIFARSDFFDIARYAKEKGFILVLLTNGTLISEKEIDELIELNPMGIEISLLGDKPETHDGITQIPGSFEKTVSTIEKLVAHGLRVTMKTTLMKQNVREYRGIKNLSQKLGVHSNIGAEILPKKDGRTDPQAYQISWEERLKYLYPDESISCIVGGIDEHVGPCKAGRAFACISPYGEVQPCVLMPIGVGNVRKNTFKEIWYPENSSILNSIRAMSASDMKECSQCKHTGYCTRCTGSAYLETGDFLAASPIACEQARWRAYCDKNR